MRTSLNHLLITLSACASIACSSSPSTATNVGDGKSITLAEATTVSTTTESATVVAIDGAARTITLAKPNGTHRTFRCRSDIANFDQIRVGDRVNATITDSVAVFVRQGSEPPFIGEGEAVALAPRGAAPGMVMANTAEVRARIFTIDPDARTITIESPGEMTTLPVGQGVDLKKFKKGDEVVLRVSESLALLVETAAR